MPTRSRTNSSRALDAPQRALGGAGQRASDADAGAGARARGAGAQSGAVLPAQGVEHGVDCAREVFGRCGG